jgi:hypothetical protein
MIAPVARTRSTRRSPPRTDASRPPLELPPDRAFVLQLDAHASPAKRLIGRIEHVTSGRVAHVGSLRELVAFLSEVVGDRAPRG